MKIEKIASNSNSSLNDKVETVKKCPRCSSAMKMCDYEYVHKDKIFQYHKESCSSCEYHICNDIDCHACSANNYLREINCLCFADTMVTIDNAISSLKCQLKDGHSKSRMDELDPVMNWIYDSAYYNDPEIKARLDLFFSLKKEQSNSIE